MNNEQREQQIKEAARQRANQYDHLSKWSDTYCGFIDGAKWADSHPAWISVEKELPKQDGRYWCCDDDGGQEELIWKDGNWYGVLDAYPIYGITHWMPLPTPPQRKEDKI